MNEIIFQGRYFNNTQNNVFVFKASLEGPVHDLSTEFSNFVFPFLIFWMVNMGICNALLKFRSQISSYKKDT